MGGAGFVFTGENDADIMHNSVSVNLNVLEEVRRLNATFDGVVNEWTECNRPKLDQPTKIFYSGSACMYPEHNQLDPDNPIAVKNQHTQQHQIQNMDGKNSSRKGYILRIIGITVYLCVYAGIIIYLVQREPGKVEEKNHQQQSVVRLHTSQKTGGKIEVWGDGLQTRSFLYIDECIEATRRLMDSEFIGPVNIGSEEMVTINQLVDTAAKVAGKFVDKEYILDAPLGVRGRNSNNDVVRKELGWDYSQTLEEGIRKTYDWIKEQIKNK
jgi:GDP-D-mannose 3', 5'-epimerase